MAYVQFNNHGYEYFSEQDNWLFSSDHTHDHLFYYAAEDLSCLPELFQQYISKRIDPATFETKSCTENSEDLEKIAEKLKSMHPYYFHEYKKVIIKAIGDYFNHLLIYTASQNKTHIPDSPRCTRWYFERLARIMPDFWANEKKYPHGLCLDDFYHSFKILAHRQDSVSLDASNNISAGTFCDISHKTFKDTVTPGNALCNASNDIFNQAEENFLLGTADMPVFNQAEENFLLDTADMPVFNQAEENFLLDTADMPVGFSDEIKTQHHVCNMLFFLLDISAKELNTLTTPQRIWLYSRIFHTSSCQPWLYMADSISFHLPAQYSGRMPAADHSIDQILKPLCSLNERNIGLDGIPAELAACFHTAVECARKISSPNAYNIYEISSLQQLLDLEIMSMLQSGTMIRKCNSCRKYFIVDNRRTAYCSRSNQSGMPCSAVGSKQSFQRKMESDEALKIYHRAYKTHHARIRNGKMKENSFLLWHAQAKENLERVRAGELELGDFRKWLKK